jgi:hypothetical protein
VLCRSHRSPHTGETRTYPCRMLPAHRDIGVEKDRQVCVVSLPWRKALPAHSLSAKRVGHVPVSPTYYEALPAHRRGTGWARAPHTVAGHSPTAYRTLAYSLQDTRLQPTGHSPTAYRTLAYSLATRLHSPTGVSARADTRLHSAKRKQVRVSPTQREAPITDSKYRVGKGGGGRGGESMKRCFE